MTRSYEVTPSPRRQLTDTDVLMLAAATAAAVWGGFEVVVVAVVLAAARRRVLTVLCCVALTIAGSLAGKAEWAAAAPRHLGVFRGWAKVVTDPAPVRVGYRVTLGIEGERFDAFAAGPQRQVVATLSAGQWLRIDARRVPLGVGARRSLERHVVGRVRLDAVSAVVAGSVLDRASDRVRQAVRRGGEAAMSPVEASLYSGLVLGDDAREPAWLIDAFRRSGLSHLTAVSGENVAFLLAAAAPMLRRLRPWWRWSATVALVAWFMALTRFEPSVLRAGVMSILAATAFVLGRTATPLRLVALAVIALVLLDPMLVWSVGFWLSVGATIGVCAVAPWLRTRLPGPAWLRAPLALTLGAQVGVALPSVLVFHRLPAVSVPANLAAVPVAGGVMLFGLPTGLVAAGLPGWAARAVMWPIGVGTRWVATVAQVAARLEPAGRWEVVAWLPVLVGVPLVLWRGSRVRAPDVPI
ncbi:MAG: ComEC/Rec2 family competence protein [Actinomycetota bacterium]